MADDCNGNIFVDGCFLTSNGIPLVIDCERIKDEKVILDWDLRGAANETPNNDSGRKKRLYAEDDEILLFIQVFLMSQN